jgi:hypothetical protein
MRQHRQGGFNLVEALLASMILSGSVLTLGALSTRALTSARLNRHYEVAASLIDTQLTLVDSIGIDQFVESGQTEGFFEAFEPGYRWQVTTEYEGTDSLYLVTVEVTWLEGKKPHSLTVQTMLNGSSLTLDTGAEGATR